MAQIFHSSMNAFAKGTIFGAVFILAGVAWAGSILVRSSYVTNVDVVRDQPVPFSHDHHTSGLGIDCRYCHTTVERNAFAGMPTTEVCMGCHSQIWTNSALLEPVRESYRSGKPLRWTRVHDLPDFVYFNHSIHVAKGIGCESCHGRVDRMPLMRQASTLHMEWCLDCHRHPEHAVRSLDEVFKFGVRENRPAATHQNQVAGEVHPSADTAEIDPAAGEQLVERYGIAKGQLTDCAICHR
jgi:hypothetical protein